MSIRLPTTDLSAAVVGTSATVSWAQQHISPSLAVQMIPAPSNAVHIQIYNESGCGILINFSGDTNTSFIPAGGWRTFAVGPDIQPYTWTVDYVLPNAPVTKLYTVWYAPGEPLDETGILGNSPIGGGVNTATSTQVVQDGQTVGQQIVEATPTGFHQSILITTDGVETLTPAIPGSGVSDAVKIRATGDTGPSRNSLFIRSDGFGGFQSSDQTVPNRSRLWGSTRGWNTDVPLDTFNAQATVGTFGIPLIVAQAIRQHITVTTQVNVLSYSVTTTGVYRVSFYVALNNGTSGQLILASVLATDPDTGVAGSNKFEIVADFSTAAGHGALSMNAANSFINQNYYGATHLVVAQSGHTIDCFYQDPANTPSDFVTYIIERLA